MFQAVARLFENWLDPFARSDNLRPPEKIWAFVWFYVSQAKMAFFLMAIFGGAVAMLEAGLFWFVGRLVDLLDTVPKDAGWDGLIAAHGGELLAMALIVLIGRFIVVTVGALVEEQVIVLNFFNLVRGQAHAHAAATAAAASGHQHRRAHGALRHRPARQPARGPCAAG